MTVYQVKDGRWICGWRDKDDRSKLKKKYFGRGIEAERQAREFDKSLGLREYGKTGDPKPQSPIFSALANAYAESRMAIMSKVSLDNWLWKMRGVIIPALGDLAAMEITPERLDIYVNDRLRTPKNPKKKPKDRTYIKRTTVHRELSDIKAVLSWATKRRYIPWHPCVGFEMPKRDDSILLPPSVDEVRALLAVAPEHLKRAISLSYYLGLRPGAVELLSLPWSSVDWNTGTIVVKSAQKGGLRSRMVPIHPGLLERLQLWKEADGEVNPDVIVHYRGQRIASLKKSFQTAKRKAKITRRLTLYGLRHAFATAALRSGADLKSTSEILGHSRPDTTIRVYQHVNRQQHKDVIDGIEPL
jgi:integrase